MNNPDGRGQVRTRNEITVLAEKKGKKKRKKKERMKERKELWAGDFPESMTHECGASQRCHKLAELLKLAHKLMSNWFLLTYRYLFHEYLFACTY